MGEVLTRAAGYDDDFFLWTQEQAQALRALGRERFNAPVDWENVAEEIESLGKRDRRACESQIGNIILHLLKLRHLPWDESRNGWEKEIRGFRKSLRRILRDSPSLQPSVEEIALAEQDDAVQDVVDELKKVKNDNDAVYLKLLQGVDWLIFNSNQIQDASFFPERQTPDGIS